MINAVRIPIIPTSDHRLLEVSLPKARLELRRVARPILNSDNMIGIEIKKLVVR